MRNIKSYLCIVSFLFIMTPRETRGDLSCSQMDYISFMGTTGGEVPCRLNQDNYDLAQQMLQTGIFVWPESSRCYLTLPNKDRNPLIYQNPNYGEDQVPSSWPTAFNARRIKLLDEVTGDVIASQFYAIARWKEGIFGGRVKFRGWNWPKNIDNIHVYYATQPFWSDYTQIRDGDCEFGNCEASIYSPMIYGDQAKESAVISMSLRRPISSGEPEIYWHSKCFKEGCQIVNNEDTTVAWPLILPLIFVALRSRRMLFPLFAVISFIIFSDAEVYAKERFRSPIIDIWHKDGRYEKMEHVPGLRIARTRKNNKGGCEIPTMRVETGVLVDEETGDEYVTTMNGHILVEIDGNYCNVTAGELESPSLEYGMSNIYIIHYFPIFIIHLFIIY